jgi:hypothetical protein
LFVLALPGGGVVYNAPPPGEMQQTADGQPVPGQQIQSIGMDDINF